MRFISKQLTKQTFETKFVLMSVCRGFTWKLGFISRWAHIFRIPLSVVNGNMIIQGVAINRGEWLTVCRDRKRNE